MEYRQHNDLSLSEIGVGCYALSGVYGPKDITGFKKMLLRAHDLGVNFFDVAAGYGDAETILGETLKPYRQQIHIATKIGVKNGMQSRLSAAEIQAACEDSLRALQTAYIDLYQVHFDDPDTPVAETVEALDGLKAAGKIRHYGVCHLPAERVETYMKLGELFSVLMEFSAVTRDTARVMLPMCLRYGVVGIAFSTAGRGLLAGRFNRDTVFPPEDLRSMDPLFQRERFESGLRIANRIGEMGRGYGLTPAQMAIAWVLAQPGIATALTGPSTLSHLEENLVASGTRISTDDLAAFERYLDEEAERLTVAQKESVAQILRSPLAQDPSSAFIDLVYFMETTIQLGLISETAGMPIFKDLFQLRGKVDQKTIRQLGEFQGMLHGLVGNRL